MNEHKKSQDEDGKKKAGHEWEQLWLDGIQRGELFDRKHALPELVRQLNNGGIEGGENVLIPGCGRGYDVEAFCKSGLFNSVLGLDISETAVQSALDYLSSVSPALPKQSFEVRVGDFFNAHSVDGAFSVIYDYSFFCAIEIERREQWAKRMRELVREGGYLITVMYPVGKSEAEGGPPFGSDASTFAALLEGAGGFIARDGPRQLNEHAHEGCELRTWWCRWQRVCHDV